MAVKKKVVEIDTQQATTSVKDLRNELKQLKDSMLSTEQGTEEYNNAMRKAADIMHTLKEQQEELSASAMDFGQITGNVVKATGGLVAGLQAAKATMNLFGVENEAVLESLQKMQNLMAITQALPALDNGVKAFKRLGLVIKSATAGMNGFKKALLTSGIGALVVALGYVVANFEEISKWLDEVTGQTDFLGNLSDKVIGGLYAGWAGLVQTIKAIGNAIYTYVATPVKGIVNAVNAFTSTQGGIGEKLKAAAKAMKDGFVSDWKDVGNDFKQIGTVAADAYQEGYDKNKARRQAKAEKEKEKQKQQEIREQKERLNRLKQAAEEEERVVAEIKKKYASLEEEIKLYNATELEKQLSDLRKEEAEALKTIEETHKKRLISDKQYEKDKLSIVEHYAKLSAEAKKQAADKEAEDARKQSIELLDTSYQLEQAKLQKQYDEKLISEQDYNDRKKQLQETYVQDYIDNIQFLLDTETNLTDEQILDLTNKINAARASLKENKTETNEEDPNLLTTKQISEAINASALALNDFSDNPAWGNILKNVATLTANWDTLHAQIKEGGTKAFSAYAQIAATALSAVAQMMNGLASEQDTSNKEGFESSKKYQIAGATMSMLAGIASAWASSMQLGPIAGPIMGSILSAFMLATGIAQIQKIKSTQFNGGSTSGSSATPNTSAVASMQAPVQYTQDVQGANIEGAIKDTRVYVTEGDISSTQKKVDVTESEARF